MTQGMFQWMIFVFLFFSLDSSMTAWSFFKMLHLKISRKREKGRKKSELGKSPMDFSGFFHSFQLWEVWCVCNNTPVQWVFRSSIFMQQKFRLRRLWWGPLRRPSLSGEGRHRKKNLGKTPTWWKGVKTWVQEKKHGGWEMMFLLRQILGVFLMLFLFSGRFFCWKKPGSVLMLFLFFGWFGDAYESWRPYLSWSFHKFRRAIL